MTTPSTRRRGLSAVFHVQAGGCGACAQSVYALLAPRYSAALAERGLTFTNSPRHADIVLLTGTVTTSSLDDLRRYLDGVPQPRALVAVGDCAIDGGVFAGAPGLVDSPAEALDVNVEIAGCPPSPEAILAAVAEAAQLLDGDEADAATASSTEDDGDTSDTDDMVDDDKTDETEGRDA
jgi:Ni,Fe-hydrogenase III small subunit